MFLSASLFAECPQPAPHPRCRGSGKAPEISHGAQLLSAVILPIGETVAGQARGRHCAAAPVCWVPLTHAQLQKSPTAASFPPPEGFSLPYPGCFVHLCPPLPTHLPKPSHPQNQTCSACCILDGAGRDQISFIFCPRDALVCLFRGEVSSSRSRRGLLPPQPTPLHQDRPHVCSHWKITLHFRKGKQSVNLSLTHTAVRKVVKALISELGEGERERETIIYQQHPNRRGGKHPFWAYRKSRRDSPLPAEHPESSRISC